MNDQKEQHAASPKEQFSFVWNGGFSYLTYLKKTCTAILSHDRLTLQTQSFVLGAFPGRTKTNELPFQAISHVAVGTKLNWFDLVFSILFAAVTLITMTFWPLLLTAFFLFRTFNTAVTLTDRTGDRINILSGSKKTATHFADTLAQAINQHMGVAQAEGSSGQESLFPLLPAKGTSNKKTAFLIGSSAIVALLVLIVAIFSRGGFDNAHIQWVKDGVIAGTDLKMSQVLENQIYFSNIEWKEVQEQGNSLDKQGNGGRRVCSSNSVRADLVEEFVFERFAEVVQKPKVLDDIIKKLNKDRSKSVTPLQKEIAALEKEMTAIESQRKRYLKLFETGNVDDDLFVERLTELKGEHDALAKRKASAEDKLRNNTSTSIPAQQVRLALAQFQHMLAQSPPETQKTLLQTAIRQIHVKDGRTVEGIEIELDPILQSHFFEQAPSAKPAAGAFAFSKQKQTAKIALVL